MDFGPLHLNILQGSLSNNSINDSPVLGGGKITARKTSSSGIGTLLQYTADVLICTTPFWSYTFQ